VDGLSEHELLGVGKSFNPIHAGYRGTQVNDLAVDAAGRLLVAILNSAGVFRSTEDGTYESIGETIPFPFIIRVHAVAAAPDDPDLYLVAANGDDTTIFRTADGGQSWSPATIIGPPIAGSTMRIAFAHSDGARVYCVRPTTLLRSVDGGQTFES